MVTILVGSQKHKFIAHKDFLTYYSEYFRACLGERFTEAENRVVELDHTEPEAFRHLMDWIYKQDIQSVAERQIEAIGASVQDVAGEYMDLWILADYLLIPELQNLVLEKLSEHKPAVLCPDVISHVYSNTGEGSMLRKFCVGLVEYSRPGWCTNSLLPPEMLLDLSSAERVFQFKASRFYVKVTTRTSGGNGAPANLRDQEVDVGEDGSFSERARKRKR